MSDLDRPNVLVVLSDQQRHDTLGCYGNPMGLTPNLDALAERGTRLARAFTPQPLCGPARGCLQTGRYATEHGAFVNDIVPAAETTLAEAFAAAGYETAYVGKWHLADADTDPVPPDRRGGYEYWRAADVLEFTSHPYEGHLYDGDGERVAFDGYRVDALTDLAVEYLRRDRDPDRPFFCVLSHLEPHHQNDLDTYVAPEGYAYRHRNPWVPPDLAGRPGGSRLNWREELPAYYGICERIDESVGRLVDALEREGLADETVVLFASDHGCHFGTRHLGNKCSPHEASIRVPALLWGPGFDGGGTVRELVSLLDVPPTLVDAAGIDPPPAMAGRSVRPLVDDHEAARDGWRDDVFVQVSASGVGRALRTDRWKYAAHAPGRDGLTEPAADRYVGRYLYDLRADPAERTNLAGHAEHADVAARLRARLRERIRAVEGASAAVDPAPDPA